MVYTTLDGFQNLIRLFHLSPASSATGDIQGRLSVALLDDQPEYEALSYAWGNANDTVAIDIDGCLLPVTKNLYSALKHLQLQEQERTLWVDALCINQADLGERMHQVSLMASIYGQASQVIVWLGDGWDGSELAFKFLGVLGGDDKLHLDPLKSPHVKMTWSHPNISDFYEQVVNFFEVPWWSRVVRRPQSRRQ